MLKFGIYFNYEHEYRRAWIYLITPTLLALTIIVASIFTYEYNSLKSFSYLRWYYPYFVRSIVWISITISFETFLRSLYERFVALNSILRYWIQRFGFFTGMLIVIFLNNIEVDFYKTAIHSKLLQTFKKMIQSTTWWCQHWHWISACFINWHHGSAEYLLLISGSIHIYWLLLLTIEIDFIARSMCRLWSALQQHLWGSWWLFTCIVIAFLGEINTTIRIGFRRAGLFYICPAHYS